MDRDLGDSMLGVRIIKIKILKKERDKERKGSGYTVSIKYQFRRGPES